MGAAPLHNKMMTADGQVFKNRAGNKENGLKKYRYYRAGKISLPAGDIETIVTDKIKKFLDSDMARLPEEKRLALKQIEYNNDLIQPMIDRIVYHDRKLRVFINIADLGYLKPFTKDGYTNTAAEPMDCYLTEDKNHAVLETQVFIANRTCINHRQGGGNVSILRKSENSQLLTKALAFGWKYKKEYENGVSLERIADNEQRNERTIYKYLNLAYLSPNITNAIMNDEVPAHVNLQMLFKIAEACGDFPVQEGFFYGN